MDISPSGKATASATMKAENGKYRIHGLRIDSDIELDEERVRGDRIDALVRAALPKQTESAASDGIVVADFVTADRRWWTATQFDSGYLLRFYETCDVFIDSELTTLTYQPAPSRGLEVVPLLLAGTGLSLLLGLRGSLVLHASGVQLDETAIAFAGLPGMGKSTLAGLLCAVGGRLISDDALRVETAGGARCYRGTSHVRLRRSAESVVALFPNSEPGVSPDDRLTLSPTPADIVCSLSALVIPHPSHGATRVEAQRIDPGEAIYRLSSFLRIARWRRPDLVRQHFLQLGELTQRVPTFVLTVPWITPFSPESAEELSAAVTQLF